MTTHTIYTTFEIFLPLPGRVKAFLLLVPHSGRNGDWSKNGGSALLAGTLMRRDAVQHVNKWP